MKTQKNTVFICRVLNQLIGPILIINISPLEMWYLQSGWLLGMYKFRVVPSDVYLYSTHLFY